MIAPIVVFVYNRVDKAQKMLDSLSANEIAIESDLFVFSDGPKKPNDEKVASVRSFLDSYDFNSKFKSTKIIKAEKNKGLACSVITGVSKVINEYGKVIVVEDDNIVASDFLTYMNGALDYYENKKSIWSISGYSHIEPQNYNHDVYLMGRINSYAWATWKRSWEKTDWKVKQYKKFKFNLSKRHQFNKYGNDSSIMLDAQMAGAIDSWAIRFSFAMFCEKMYTIYPSVSKAHNIGEDGSGTHVATSKVDSSVSFSNKVTRFENVKLDEKIIKQFSKAVHRKMITRVKYFVKYAVLGRK